MEEREQKYRDHIGIFKRLNIVEDDLLVKKGMNLEEAYIRKHI